MSSFFTIPGAQKKRKRTENSEIPKKRFATSKAPSKSNKAPPKKAQRDESISGSDSESDGPAAEEDEAETSGSESGEEETAAERRLRLAERYLENIREEVVDPEGFDAEDIDRDLIAERLQEDVAESKGRIYRTLADELDFKDARHSLFRNNTETVTAVAVCAPYTYTVSKDMALTKWRIQDLPDEQLKVKKKKKKGWKPVPAKRVPEQVAYVRGDKREAKNNAYQGHTDSILCVATSQDGKFVVTGGKDRRLIVWDANLKPLRVFSQHRDAVTGLAFRRGTNQLYSASKDRTIKIWSLDELAYVETLFGHQDEVVDIAALAQERCISVGARDRTARLWKVVEETQLVFRGGGSGKKSKSIALEGSMDCVAMIDEEMFVTGSDNGSISLWTMHKKKPIFTLPLAHGIDPPLKHDEASAEANPSLAIIPQAQPRWVTALTTIPYSDVILSGSWSGDVRAWKLSDDKKKIEELGAISSTVNGEETEQKAARGVVNSISIFERGDRAKDGICVVVATGKEHRLGSWQRKHIPGAKNGAVVFEVARASKENGTNGVNGTTDTDFEGLED
ncbi:WD40 repeat-like protein [Coleophoma cylindrospora]|uniref:WD40 repeat-like protein n=1 Tax=Coleophoma cylindrospora TaxID=1849047 RepID=A0A3D8R0P2_9HELO|nr:WD40 repeat-like protein [Coleophoma cylindrospora]